MNEEELKRLKAERDKDTEKVLESTHSRRVVLASPGTGKSYLLAEAIKRKRKEGKTKFHAITFLGKLEHALADDLAGLADTTTLHSFCRTFVLEHRNTSWVYFKDAKEIFQKDLEVIGKKDVKVSDDEYTERSEYYKAIGVDDVVYYAVQLCEDEDKIPSRDLFLIDEFQDFNEIEDAFITLLANKNEVLIVGDDDQALYTWKGADPKFIREKHSTSNSEYEGLSLRWCSRCPEVIINSFHEVVKKYPKHLKDRSKKEYLFYPPEKQEDSDLNPKIYLTQSGYTGFGNKIRRELEKILATQKIKTVLVIGEARSCASLLNSAGTSLKEAGFNNVDHKSEENNTYSFDTSIIDAYKFLKKDRSSILAWRILANKLSDKELKKIVSENFTDPNGFINSLNAEFKRLHIKNAEILYKLIKGPKSVRSAITADAIEKLENEIVLTKKEYRELLTRQIIKENHYLKSPLANLEITVCNIMGSKGLGADVVFLLGFDEQKLPAQSDPTPAEVYQLLVALTRTKKRLYLVNTMGCNVSSFLHALGADNVEVV